MMSAQTTKKEKKASIARIAPTVMLGFTSPLRIVIKTTIAVLITALVRSELFDPLNVKNKEIRQTELKNNPGRKTKVRRIPSIFVCAYLMMWSR